MKILIVEDWWADRLRFQYLLAVKGIELDFAWAAGRPPSGGRVWTINHIVEVAAHYDRIVIDLALTKEDEDRFREAHAWTDREFVRRERALDEQITGLKLIASLAAARPKTLRAQVIVASAHVYDRLRDHCIKKWGVVDTFHKWADESLIIQTLFESKLRSNSGE